MGENEAEQDELWLFDKCEKIRHRPTDDQIESFIERVSIRVANGLSSEYSRITTFREMFNV